MTVELTPGRYRGLKSTSIGDNAIFGILACDQRGSFRKMMPDGMPYADLVAAKDDIIITLSANASAALTDPLFGLSPAMQMNGNCGLLMALEKSGYSGDDSYRRTELMDGWTPEKIRKMGGNAVKFMVYYNPVDNPELADELDELTRNTIAACHAQDLPVFLEPMSYSADPDVKKSSPEFAAKRADIVLETARRLSETGADVLKMEFPLDLKHNSDHAEWGRQCQQLSDACTVPWVLLSAGVDFEEFVPQVEIACDHGASGFLAGRAIWKEATTMQPTERKTFLSGLATDRLKQLIDIAVAKSRPWTDFYTMENTTENWFESYN